MPNATWALVIGISGLDITSVRGNVSKGIVRHTPAILGSFLVMILLFPLGLLTIHLLRRNEGLGLVLAPIMYVKGLTLAISVLGMMGFMALAGTPATLPEVGIFVIMTAVFAYATVLYLGCIDGYEKGGPDPLPALRTSPTARSPVRRRHRCRA